MKKKIALVGLILLILMHFSASAQIARLYDTRYNFSNSQINDIFQDSDGFIWICANNGLTRFDGRYFFTLSHDDANESSIASNTVLTMMEDSQSRIWVGTSRGLQLYDKEFGSFSRFDFGDPDVPNSAYYISDMMEVRENNGKKTLIISTSQHGVFFIDALTLAQDRQRILKINEGLSSLYIYKMARDSENRLWIASALNGIDVFDLDTDRKLEFQGTSSIRGDANVLEIREDEATGKVFIATSNDGMYVYAKNEGRIRRATDRKLTEISVRSMMAGPMPQSEREGIMMLGTSNGGFRFLDTKSEMIVDLPLSNIRYDTSRWKIHSLMRDVQGNIWAGVYQTGLFLIPQSMFGFSYEAFNPDGNGSEKSECVTAVSDDGEDGLWIGTDGYGLLHKSKDGRKEFFDTGNSGIISNSIRSIVTDKRGTSWFSSFDEGLFLYRKGSGFRQFADQKSIGISRCTKLFYDRENDLIYVGTHGNGFCIVDPVSETVLKTVSDDFSKWNSGFAMTGDGTIWVGTYNGICRYDRPSGELKVLDLNSKAGNPQINCITAATDGKLLAGSPNGLIEYDPKSGNFRIFTVKDGLNGNGVVGIIEDNDGSFWIATLRGMTHMRADRKTFSRFYQNDGLQDNQFYAAACFKAEDGTMYFGGNEGLTYFRSGAGEMRQHVTPQIRFTGLLVNGERIDYSSPANKGILDRNITRAKQITLPYSENGFSIVFTLAEYTNPQRVAYSYRLLGAGKEWKKLENQARSVTFADLGHGKYTLQVRAYLEGSPESFSSRDIDIRIKAPFWLSIWAILVYLAVLGLVGFIVWRQMQKTLKHKKEQEESRIKDMKISLFTNLSHEIKTPLTLVMSPLNTLRESSGSAEDSELYDLMYRNANRILRTVNEILDMQKVEDGQLQIHFVENDIHFFIRDLIKSFENMAAKKNITMEFEENKDVKTLWFDPSYFDKVLFNLLSNSFKFSPDNSKIRISLSSPVKNDGELAKGIGEYVRIQFDNQSPHIPESDLSKIFDRFYQSDSAMVEGGSGIGLYFCKQLIALHHGKIWAENTADGVRFSILLPAGKEHLSEKETTGAELKAKGLYSEQQNVMAESVVEDKPAEAVEETATSKKSHKRVVIIDDNTELLNYFKKEFADEYEVSCFTNAHEGWAEILGNTPEAVIVDLNLNQDIDGVEICRRIKSNPVTNHIPVIILTGDNNEKTMRECSNIGADKYVIKPVSVELMKSYLNQVISTRETLLNKFKGKFEYDYSELKINSSESKLVEKIISVIKDNMDNSDFSVEDLSKEIGISRVHLNRKLKETMNVSPSTLIKSIRLKQAAYLLVNNKVNVSEVAYLVGFSTHSYFSSSFREYFGMTPKEFVAKFSNSKDEEKVKKLLEQ